MTLSAKVSISFRLAATGASFLMASTALLPSWAPINLAGQVGLGLDGRGAAHDDDLVVGHVGRGEADVLLALFR